MLTFGLEVTHHLVLPFALNQIAGKGQVTYLSFIYPQKRLFLLDHPEVTLLIIDGLVFANCTVWAP